jgi:hypothetical protein
MYFLRNCLQPKHRARVFKPDVAHQTEAHKYLDMFVLTEQVNDDRQEAAGHSAALSRRTDVLTTGSGSMASVSGHLQETTFNFMIDVFMWLELIVMDEHELTFC